HLRSALGLLDVDLAADLGELGRSLRVPRLEDLDDARETVRDVGAGDAARVEGPHRELRARLADRLRGDDPDRVADLAHVPRGEERAVAGLAHAELAAALQHRADGDLRLGRRVAQPLAELEEAPGREQRALLGEPLTPRALLLRRG